MKKHTSIIKNIKKTAVLCTTLTAAILSSSLYAFDWPQAEIESDSFYSYFGQLRAGVISNSLIFHESSDIKSVDNGTIIALIGEHDGDQGWFNSPLGNAVIIAHKDNLLTIYGNLDGSSLPENIEKT